MQCRRVTGKVLFPCFKAEVGEQKDDRLQDAKEKKAREFIIDVCEVLNIRTTYLVDSAYNILKRMQDEKDLDIHFNKYVRAKAAFAIWEALKRQGTPYNPHVIANCCAVPHHYLLTIEKKYVKDYPITDASEYVERICDLLGIPYKLTIILQKIVADLQYEYAGCHPETLIGAVILKHIGQNSCYYLLGITDAVVSDALGIKIKTIKKVMKKIPTFIIKYERLAGKLIYYRTPINSPTT